MRSDLIYNSLKPVNNRYMLCQLVSKATRKFHRPNTRIQETMNEVLERIATSNPEQVASSEVEEIQSRAA